MGQLVVPKKTWPRGSNYIIAACLCVVLTGIAGYKTISDSNITIVVDTNEPNAVKEILSNSGGRVYSVVKKEDETYQIKLFMFKNVNSFLEGLRRNKEFKKVELENN
jgi:hypothetical protein